MTRSILGNGSGDENIVAVIVDEALLALIVKEGGAFQVGALEQLCKGEVAAFDGVAADECPFGEDDRLVLGRAKCERVAMHDVLGEDVAGGAGCGLGEWGFEAFYISVADDFQQPLAADGDVVGQQINAVNGADREDGIALPLEAAAWMKVADPAELAEKDFVEEVAFAAGRFEEAGFEAVEFMPDQVKHVLEQPIGREHLTMIDDTLPGIHGFGGGGLVRRGARRSNIGRSSARVYGFGWCNGGHVGLPPGHLSGA